MPETVVGEVNGPPEPAAPQVLFVKVADCNVSELDAKPDWVELCVSVGFVRVPIVKPVLFVVLVEPPAVATVPFTVSAPVFCTLLSRVRLTVRFVVREAPFVALNPLSVAERLPVLRVYVAKVVGLAGERLHPLGAAAKLAVVTPLSGSDAVTVNEPVPLARKYTVLPDPL